MRTTVTLDDDIYEAAMSLARSSGKRLGKVLSEMAREALRRPAPRKRKGARFPTFDVPRDAPMIPASRIQDVLEDEGIA